MKNLLPLLFCLSIALFPACQGEASQTATTETAPGPAKRPVEDGRIIREEDNSRQLVQEAATGRIEFARTDAGITGTYMANGKDLQKEMVEEGGLSSYEAHLAKMFALGSAQCSSLPDGQNKLTFILVNNENKLQGRFDLPCNFIRRVYSTIGAGAAKEFTTNMGTDDLVISTNLLNITEQKLPLFQNIVQGIQPIAHDGIEIGQKMK